MMNTSSDGTLLSKVCSKVNRTLKTSSYMKCYQRSEVILYLLLIRQDIQLFRKLQNSSQEKSSLTGQRTRERASSRPVTTIWDSLICSKLWIMILEMLIDLRSCFRIIMERLKRSITFCRASLANTPTSTFSQYAKSSFSSLTCPEISTQSTSTSSTCIKLTTCKTVEIPIVMILTTTSQRKTNPA